MDSGIGPPLPTSRALDQLVTDRVANCDLEDVDRAAQCGRGGEVPGAEAQHQLAVAVAPVEVPRKSSFAQQAFGGRSCAH